MASKIKMKNGTANGAANASKNGAKNGTSNDTDSSSLVTKLQQQIDDLALFLEEERLNHRETKRKFETQMQDKIQELTDQHQGEIKSIQDAHQEEIATLTFQENMKLKEVTNSAEAAQTKLKTEVEFLQGAFESYKSQIHMELDDKWKKREDDLKLKYEEGLQEKVHQLKSRLIAEKATEKAENSKEHQKEMQALLKEKKKEMEAIHRKMSTSPADNAKLKETEQKYQECLEEKDKVQKAYDDVCKQMTAIMQELSETKVRLMSFETSFDEKVQEVDLKYQEQINSLKQQNSELRTMYMKKCGELFDEKTHSEEVRVESLSNAKDTMKLIIETRERTQVSLAAMDPRLARQPLVPKTRPASAPGTKNEADTACLSAGETRPHTAMSRTKHLRHSIKDLEREISARNRDINH